MNVCCQGNFGAIRERASATHQHDHAMGGNIIGERLGQTDKLAIGPNVVWRG